jgi:hypothetical protein
MSGPPATAAAPTTRPDPQPDTAASGGATLGRFGRALSLVRKLIDYGKQLAATLQQHAVAATDIFTITMNFGTADIAEIAARIARALHLAGALEDRLISRAAQPERAPPIGIPAVRQPRAALPAERPATPAAQRDAGVRRCLDGLPTAEDIAAQMRRRPICAVIAEICRDLGIKPSHPLWRELSWVIFDNGGNVSGLLKHIFKQGSLYFERWCAERGIDMYAPLWPPQPRAACNTAPS